MARQFKVTLGKNGGYVRVAAEKDSSTISDHFCHIYLDARRGNAVAQAAEIRIGGFHGKSGNYTACPRLSTWQEWVSGFRTLQEVMDYLVEVWVKGELAAQADAALAASLEAQAAEAVATQSFGWVTSEHARAAFHALAREWANGGPFYGATHSTQPLFQAQAAFFILKVAETDTLLALPAKVNRYHHCPTCGDPTTVRPHIISQVPCVRDKDAFTESRTVARGAEMGRDQDGSLQRFCRNCAAFAHWLALPEGDDPDPDYTHMAEAHSRIMQEQQDLLEQVGMAGMEARGMANGRVPADQDAITALVERLYTLSVSLRENLMYQEGVGNCLANLAEPDTDPYLDTEPVVDDSDPYGYGDDYIHQDYFEAHFEAHLELA